MHWLLSALQWTFLGDGYDEPNSKQSLPMLEFALYPKVHMAVAKLVGHVLPFCVVWLKPAYLDICLVYVSDLDCFALGHFAVSNLLRTYSRKQYQHTHGSRPGLAEAVTGFWYLDLTLTRNCSSCFKSSLSSLKELDAHVCNLTLSAWSNTSVIHGTKCTASSCVFDEREAIYSQIRMISVSIPVQCGRAMVGPWLDHFVDQNQKPWWLWLWLVTNTGHGTMFATVN